jgi:AcrR family transcriptional regulator
MARIVKKHDERRSEIVSTARRLFEEREYEHTTMQDLMKELNIAKGTIYHYFASKEELLEAVVEDIIDGEFRRKQALVDRCRVEKLSAIEIIVRMVTDRTPAQDNEQILETLHRPENLTLHVRQLGRYIEKLGPLWQQIFEQGNSEGVFRVTNPLECAETILSGIQFVTDTGFYPWSEAQLARRMAALPAILEALLGTRKGAFSFLAER